MAVKRDSALPGFAPYLCVGGRKLGYALITINGPAQRLQLPIWAGFRNLSIPPNQRTVNLP
jgi:hypothetical protein